MAKKGGGGGSQQVVQTADPWSGAQPSLSQLYARTAGWAQNGGVRVAGMTPEQLAGMGQMSQWGNSSQPYMNSARGTIDYIGGGQAAMDNPITSGQMLRQDAYANGSMDNIDPTAAGKYLTADSNPYLKQMTEAAMRPLTDNFMNSIAPSLASQFSAAGRMGSGSHVSAVGNAEQNLGRQLGDTTANIYGNAYSQERSLMEQAKQAAYSRRYGAYEQERGMQGQGWLAQPGQRLQAAGMMPGLVQAGFATGQNQLNTGNQLQQWQQQNLDAEGQTLQQWAGVMSGAAPYASSNSNSKQQLPTNRLSGAIGGGLGGYALGAMTGLGGGMGALIGGGLGLFG